MKSHLEIYYLLKPFVPRRLQIALRRLMVARTRSSKEHIWPIDPKSNRRPEGWSGWPRRKQFALVLTHDVDTARGQEKCRDLMGLEKKLGFRSSFNFVPRRYAVQPDLRNVLTKEGFEVGVHGLYHDGRYFDSREKFRKRAEVINDYLKEWGSVGFRSPSMLHNLDWIHDLNIEYDASTFDTDPFEPQPNGVGTIFPFWVPRKSSPCSSLLVPCSVSSGVQPSSSNLQPPTASVNGYVELPYTLPQDFTLFILMKERDVNIWRRKLDWIVEHGGMALLLTHPDYMNGEEKNCGIEEYPVRSYEEFLRYIRTRYQDQFWNPLPKEMARFWKENMVFPQLPESVE